MFFIELGLKCDWFLRQYLDWGGGWAWIVTTRPTAELCFDLTRTKASLASLIFGGMFPWGSKLKKSVHYVFIRNFGGSNSKTHCKDWMGHGTKGNPAMEVCRAESWTISRVNFKNTLPWEAGVLESWPPAPRTFPSWRRRARAFLSRLWLLGRYYYHAVLFKKKKHIFNFKIYHEVKASSKLRDGVHLPHAALHKPDNSWGMN